MCVCTGNDFDSKGKAVHIESLDSRNTAALASGDNVSITSDTLSHMSDKVSLPQEETAKREDESGTITTTVIAPSCLVLQPPDDSSARSVVMTPEEESQENAVQNQ